MSPRGYKADKTRASGFRVGVGVRLVLVLWFMPSGGSSWSLSESGSVRGRLVVWAEAIRGATRSLELAVGRRVRATHRRRGLEAQLCRLCGASIRVRVGSAGESLPATREARGYASCHGDETSRPAHRRTARVRVSRVGLVGPFGQPRLTYHKGPRTLSATLVCGSGPFLSFE